MIGVDLPRLDGANGARSGLATRPEPRWAAKASWPQARWWCMAAMYRLAATLPAPVARAAGRLAARHQWLMPLVHRAKPSGPTTIRRGAAAGMRIWADSRSNLGYALGTTEPIVQAALVEYLNPGGVCYDIGANVGFFTLVAAAGPRAQERVYAFEPLPENAAALRRNLGLNGLANVEVIEAAVSDRNGTAQLDLGSSSLDPCLIEHALTPLEEITVPVVRLDDAGLLPPSFVKIDVEGAECDVLAGMRRIVMAHRPVILCEMHHFGADYVAEFRGALGDVADRYDVRLLEQDAHPDAWAPHVLAVPH